MVLSPENALPDYASVAAAIGRCGVPQGPSEVQGFALGLFAAGVPEAHRVWQQELYSDFDPKDVLAGECRTILERVFASVFATPAAINTHTLLLPEDIVVDAARLAAVRDWCQGFLYGFGLGGEAAAQRLSPQARELLADIAEVTRLDTASVSDSKENQSALIEIEEYLRVGAVLIRDDLDDARRRDETQTP
ncbi:MAG: UPF0149 family protein [Sedimenticolaceae bacterium]